MRTHTALMLLALAALPAAMAAELVGSTCGTVSPDSRLQCCQGKVEQDVSDDYCFKTFPQLYSPPIGASCASRGPAYSKACCEGKVKANQEDSYCKEAYPELYEGGSSSGSKPATDLPFLAYVKTPIADCAGSLVAPGFVLTAAQCVFKEGKPSAAEDVSVWVGGKWHSVATVLVNSDDAQFAEFQNPKTEGSWDIAMLALTEDSAAPYVALPTSDQPAAGEWLLQTAWDVPESTVLTALINQWDGCPAEFLWADDFCAGGSGFLGSPCPADKGAPMLANVTQVGLASGPGCAGAAGNYGAFVRLADRGVLEQITVWLNNGGGKGLDATVQAWISEAYKYIYQQPAAASTTTTTATGTPAAANPLGMEAVEQPSA